MSDRVDEFERGVLIEEIMEIQGTREQFKDKLLRILDEYIVFKKKRPHEIIE